MKIIFLALFAAVALVTVPGTVGGNYGYRVCHAIGNYAGSWKEDQRCRKICLNEYDCPRDRCNCILKGSRPVPVFTQPPRNAGHGSGGYAYKSCHAIAHLAGSWTEDEKCRAECLVPSYCPSHCACILKD